jgi:hypothetical protein
MSLEFGSYGEIHGAKIADPEQHQERADHADRRFAQQADPRPGPGDCASGVAHRHPSSSLS